LSAGQSIWFFDLKKSPHFTEHSQFVFPGPKNKKKDNRVESLILVISSLSLYLEKASYTARHWGKKE
jgi:hypothetical protein